MKKQYITLLLACSLLSSCSFAPEYQQPQDMVSPYWMNNEGAVDKVAGAEVVSKIPYQDFFQSEELRKVISIGLENNKDLRVAVLNIERAQAAYNIQRADRFPKVEGLGNATIYEDFDGNVIEEIYQVGLAIPAYELDLFGRVKSLSNAALNEYFASESARNSFEISLISQIALSYLQLITSEENVQLAKETLSAQEKSYDLMEKTYTYGLSTKLDLAQVRIAVETARTDLVRFSRLVIQNKNALVALLGVKDIGDIPIEKRLSSVALLQDLPIGLPSQVLLKRPDIQQAEFQLRAAGANIGAARANFFPRISLTGQLGYSSADINDLFNNFGWGFLPTISMPIFNTGQVRAQLKVAEADQKIAVANYEKAVQTAFKEVADELAARDTLSKQLAAQRELVNASQDAYDLSLTRYNQGIDNFLSVLDSQRSLFSAQQGEIETKRQKLANQVNLYKVLGGGLAVDEK